MTFKEARAEARLIAQSRGHYWGYICTDEDGEWFATGRPDQRMYMDKDLFVVSKDGRVLRYKNYIKCQKVAKGRGDFPIAYFEHNVRNRRKSETKKAWHKAMTALRVLR